MITMPASLEEYENVKVLRGPNIQPIPSAKTLENELTLPVSLKVGDNITTDHIMPAGASILPYRSNLPKLATFCFVGVDETFPERAKALQESIIIGGENYGQGSSREHAALAPLYLGVRVVIAKSFARIHKANLVNAGILPLEFSTSADYDILNQNDIIEFSDIFNGLENGKITAQSKTTNKQIVLSVNLSKRQIDYIKAGGLLNYTKKQTEI